MKRLFLLVLIWVASTAFAHRSAHFNAALNEDWGAYKVKHGKNYKTHTEENQRRATWEMTLKKIHRHNIRYDLGKVTYTLEMNKYGDMTNAEFVKMMNGYKKSIQSVKKSSSNFMAPLHTKIPASVDWRTEGYVTPVADQGQCGSCWAFSATGALEGQTFRKTGQLPTLSVQNLIDCSGDQGNQGCCGGFMDQAFQYIMEKGIEMEKDYPYIAEDGVCQYTPSKKAAEDTGFVDLPSGNETTLTTVIATVGPISIAFDASHDSFRLYSGGVYNEPACSSSSVDHAALAVGYGNDPNGGDYYIVKNSWGLDWGMKGYILMSRNRNNQCGIATCASYPTV